jgi:hypothetical protein
MNSLAHPTPPQLKGIFSFTYRGEAGSHQHPNELCVATIRGSAFNADFRDAPR